MDNLWPKVGAYADALRNTPRLPGESLSEHMERVSLKAREIPPHFAEPREPGDDDE